MQRRVFHVRCIVRLVRIVSQPDFSHLPWRISTLCSSSWKTFYGESRSNLQIEERSRRTPSLSFHPHELGRLNCVYWAISNVWCKRWHRDWCSSILVISSCIDQVPPRGREKILFDTPMTMIPHLSHRWGAQIMNEKETKFIFRRTSWNGEIENERHMANLDSLPAGSERTSIKDFSWKRSIESTETLGGKGFTWTCLVMSFSSVSKKISNLRFWTRKRNRNLRSTIEAILL